MLGYFAYRAARGTTRAAGNAMTQGIAIVVVAPFVVVIGIPYIIWHTVSAVRQQRAAYRRAQARLAARRGDQRGDLRTHWNSIDRRNDLQYLAARRRLKTFAY